MIDTEFLEWWDGCAWHKTSASLNNWPREKMAEIDRLTEALNEVLAAGKLWDAHAIAHSALNTESTAGWAAGAGGVGENATPKEATDNK